MGYDNHDFHEWKVPGRPASEGIPHARAIGENPPVGRRGFARTRESPQVAQRLFRKGQNPGFRIREAAPRRRAPGTIFREVTHLLDTNACVAVLRGNKKVSKRLGALSPDDIAVSVVTVYELQTGAEKCSNPGRESGKISAFLEPLHVLPYDRDSAVATAKIRAALESRGLAIGAYDLLLAGHAVALGLVLVTRNLREFQRIGGLRLENWED
jgi:tRNA(fMet)-specific endonuclease VapC